MTETVTERKNIFFTMAHLMDRTTRLADYILTVKRKVMLVYLVEQIGTHPFKMWVSSTPI